MNRHELPRKSCSHALREVSTVLTHLDYDARVLMLNRSASSVFVSLRWVCQLQIAEGAIVKGRNIARAHGSAYSCQWVVIPVLIFKARIEKEL
jgi:hypothetical protein